MILPRLLKVFNASVKVGFQYGELHEKIMLCAEDMLLFLRDTSSSLTSVMSGRFSDLTINWTKSALMLDNSLGRAAYIPCSILLVTSFRYLGIQISRNIVFLMCIP